MRLRNGNWWVLFVLTSFFLSSCARVARRDGVDALQKPSAKTETAWGLHTVTFETLQGRIRVNLPDDMAAGDSVSGSVIGEPGGETETERRQNADHLNGYVVEINKTKTPVFRKVLKWTIPAALIGRETAVPAILRDNEGKEVATVMVPIQPTPPPIEQPTTPVPGDYHLPRIGQAGKSIQISGPFDSDFKTTRVRVRGEQLQLLAQSPRKAIVDSPLDVVGPTEIEIREGDVVANGPYNNLRLSLKAGQTSLTGGERTTLTAEMSGLEELDQDVSLRVINERPGVVRFGNDDGDVVWRVVSPEDVQPGGVYLLTVPLIGIQRGAFNIRATVSLARDDHSKRLSKRAPHDWEKSSLPRHNAAATRRGGHRARVSQKRPHHRDTSRRGRHEPEISNRTISQRYGPGFGDHHGRRDSSRPVHRQQLSNRPQHQMAKSTSYYTHEGKISNRPRHLPGPSKSAQPAAVD